MVTTTATRIITNDLTAEQLTRAIQQLPLAFITEQGKSGSVYFKVMGDDRATFGVAWGGKGQSWQDADILKAGGNNLDQRANVLATAIEELGHTAATTISGLLSQVARIMREFMLEYDVPPMA
jgi:hypothetical protein